MRSDTLYGLICWHIAENEGEAACKDLIDAFRKGQPPFALSSAMPENFLPMPLLPPISRRKFQEFALTESQGKGEEENLFSMLQAYKKFHKQKGLSLEVWQRHKTGLSSLGLFRDWLKNHDKNDRNKKFSQTAYQPHVSIDRASGQAAEGLLFFDSATWFDSEAKFHLYARTDNPEWLAKYLSIIGEQGFGADANLGKGRFFASMDNGFRAADLEMENNSAYFLLSVCASPKMENMEGYYKLDVKRGKTGPGYKNPFKIPFLMLKEGSVLSSLPRSPYVLDNLCANEKVAQILQPLTLPCSLA